MKIPRLLAVVSIVLGALVALPAAASAADGLAVVPPQLPPPPQPILLTAAEYPSALTGERLDDGPLVGEINLIESSSGVKVVCESAEFVGGELTGPVTEFELDASYAECESGGESKVTASVDMTSCSYSYGEFSQIEGERFETEASLVCDEGDAVKLKAGGCKITIPPQELFSELISVNPFGEDFLLSETGGFEDVDYTTGGGLTCAAIGLGFTEQTHEDGSMHLQAALHGKGSG